MIAQTPRYEYSDQAHAFGVPLPSLRHRGAGVALLAAAAFTAAAALYVRVIQSQGGAPGTPPSTLAIGLLVGSMALSAVLGALLPGRLMRLVFLSATTLAGLGLGLLAIFSIGTLVLLGAVLSGVAYAAAMAGVPPRSRSLATVAGGAAALAALGAVFLPGMAAHVTCMPGGAIYTSGWSLGGGTSSGSGSVSESANRGTVTGSGVDNGRPYHFTCQDGRLVEFTQGR